VSDTVATTGVEKMAAAEPRPGVMSSRRGRAIRESLLAYLFLLPAFLIIFIFGIFPLAFSAYQSTLRGLNRIVGTPAGMDNYVRATGELAYVVGFWLAIIFLLLAFNQLRQLVAMAREHAEQPWPLALPGIVLGVGFALFTRAFFIFLPLLLGIADQMRAAQQQGEGPPSELFRRFVGETLALPEVRDPFLLSLGVLLAGALLAYLVLRNRPHNPRQGGYFGAFFQITVLTLAALALGWFTWQSVEAAYLAAAESETELAIWSHIVTISAGFVLLGLSWLIWRSASRRDSNLSTVLRLAAAAVLMIGAWVLIGEIPRAAAAGDSRWWAGLLNTVWYSLGSIPFQFAISLMLATFLFQNIKGKALFRMIYFLPYITPTVGAAAVFRVIFSGRATAPMNSLLSLLGMDTLGWLNEPTGIFQLMAGSSVALPAWAAGPSLSLVVIIIFGVWSFVGFNTVIFLAGLGAIPTSLYEAASIDGAGRWAQFRHVTLPLLSPTIYFLTLYAVIGTFKAFNHIYVLRSPAALGTADTISVVIFDAMKRDTRYGYAAALAMLLLIIVMALTVVNNRIASRRVFYG
jgi:ABC-type sugar transport system permease subunit